MGAAALQLPGHRPASRTWIFPNSLLFGHNFGVLDAIYESRVQFSDSLAWVKGKHVAKFGVDVNYVKNFVIWPGFTPMRIVLPGVNCLVDFANFVNPTAGIPSAPADGPCPGDSAVLPVGPFAECPRSAERRPIVFWGDPVGSGAVTPGFEPPPIPTNWAERVSSFADREFFGNAESQLLRFLRAGSVAPHSQADRELRRALRFRNRTIEANQSGLSRRATARGIRLFAEFSKTVIRAGFGLFDDRYNLSFLFITQPQRPIMIPGGTLPGIRAGADSATWVLEPIDVRGRRIRADK